MDKDVGLIVGDWGRGIWLKMSSKNDNKTYFGSLKLSHCKFEAINYIVTPSQRFFFLLIYQSMKFISL